MMLVSDGTKILIMESVGVSNLTIMNFMATDGGIYTCNATNSAGTAAVSSDVRLGKCYFYFVFVCSSALKPGRVIPVNRVTFSPGHPGLTRIGSREKRNCSFDDVETYKR